MGSGPNVVTKFQGWCLPRLARKPNVVRIIAMQSPVFSYVMTNAESPFGIEPLYRYQLWFSPLDYIRLIWRLPVNTPLKTITIVFGLTIGWLWTLFFHQMGNIKDVRWRARQVEEMLYQAIHEQATRLAPRDGPVRIDVYGAGSARYSILAWIRARNDGLGPVKIRFVDNDPRTLDLAKYVASQNGIDEAEFKTAFTFIDHNVLLGPPATGEEDRPHIITLVGLGDHIDKNLRRQANADSAAPADVVATNPHLVKLYAQIREALAPGGVFVSTYVQHNPEEVFLAKVALWRHRYRSWAIIRAALSAGGWPESEGDHFSGPNHIQNVVRLTNE